MDFFLLDFLQIVWGIVLHSLNFRASSPLILQDATLYFGSFYVGPNHFQYFLKVLWYPQTSPTCPPTVNLIFLWYVNVMTLNDLIVGLPRIIL